LLLLFSSDTFFDTEPLLRQLLLLYLTLKYSNKLLNTMKFLKVISVLFLFFALQFSAKATHIVGGEIGYECLGNDQYRITLTVYRDCYNGQVFFDNPASIGFFVDTLSTALYELKIPATTWDTLDIVLTDPCLKIPPDVCVDVMQYSDTITLPYQSDGYTLVYQRCCRNETLLNIVNPLETGASFVTQMTGESMLQCNSSPTFKNWPPVALCVDKLLDFDHSALDAEGDSIVYTLCVPYLGAAHSNTGGNPMPQPPMEPITTEVAWINPYDVTNMLGGIPLSIDPMTGQLTAIPNTIGQFVVGVCMTEFRNGVLLSEIKRDFQFNVSDCGEVVSSFFVPEIICDQLTINFDNLSQHANSYFWDFGVGGVNSDTSNLQSPMFTYQDTGSYDITLIASKDLFCIDTFVNTINLRQSSFDIGVDWDVVGCSDSIKVHVIDQTYDSSFQIVDWNWQFSNDIATISSDSMNPYFVLPAGKNTMLHAIVTSSNGCVKELDIPFPFEPIDPLSSNQFLVCSGSDVALNPNGDNTLLYDWLPETLLDDAHSFNPLITNIQESEDFTVSVTSLDSVCMRHFMVNVDVQNISVFAQAIPDTILAGESSQLTTISSEATQYLWTPPDNLNSDIIANPIAMPDETTEYQVVVESSAGCENKVTVRVVVLNPDCALPNVFVPSGFTPNHDGKNDEFKVYGFIVESLHMMIFDRWGEKVFETKNQSTGWDGTFKGKELPPDVYGFYVQVKCINGEEYIKQGNVTLIR